MAFSLANTNGGASTGYDMCDATRPDYTVSSTAGQAGTSCKKDGFWLHFTGLGTSGQCTFGEGVLPYIYTLYYTVGCGTGISDNDCPFFQSPTTTDNNAPARL